MVLSSIQMQQDSHHLRSSGMKTATLTEHLMTSRAAIYLAVMMIRAVPPEIQTIQVITEILETQVPALQADITSLTGTP